MPRRFDQRGWNRQFKWQPVRTDRWDVFPKDRIPFVDDFSESSRLHAWKPKPIHEIDPQTPQRPIPQGAELLTPHVDVPWNTPWNNRIGNNRIIPEHHNFGFAP